MAGTTPEKTKDDADLSFRTQADLAAYLNISVHTLRGWIENGCPARGNGPHSLRGVCHWLCGEKANRFRAPWAGGESRDRAADARARKDEADAQLKELELQRRLGNLCEISKVRLVFAEGLIRVRKHFERLHVKLRPRMPREAADGICSAIAEEVKRILESLAGGWEKEIENFEEPD